MSFDTQRISNWHKTLLVILRFAIGWHLFYQGFGKLLAVKWSAVGYLKAAWGPFVWIAEDPTLLSIADYAMVWSLIVLGILLMLGLFTRIATVLGILLLLSIYVAVPPLDWTGFVATTAEGSELYVNKLLIEILALILVASFRTGHMIGLDILVHHWRTR